MLKGDSDLLKRLKDDNISLAERKIIEDRFKHLKDDMVITIEPVEKEQPF